MKAAHMAAFFIIKKKVFGLWTLVFDLLGNTAN